MPGSVVYEELALDNELTLADQVDRLNEDLLQVEFPGKVLLDLGWYPAFSNQGQFQVYVVRDANWDEPLFYAEVASLDVLYSVLEAARRTAAEAAMVAV
ncbi:hypothetical protein KFU94_40050 [Chloroflexi bacterium TSY]|nr:hypothetical protein [Chloroflexi bacterium TSY]